MALLMDTTAIVASTVRHVFIHVAVSFVLHFVRLISGFNEPPFERRSETYAKFLFKECRLRSGFDVDVLYDAARAAWGGVDGGAANFRKQI
jgi:hypothetical protein